MNSNKLLSFLLFLILGICLSCEQEKKTSEEFNVSIRLRTDPGKINPMVGNPTIESTQINSLIFLPLAHYDPISYKLSPVLIKELKPGIPITEGEYEGGIQYDYEILPDAVWDDGTPVTGEDYLFTVKAAKNPNIEATSWRGLLTNLVAINIDKENPKKFSIVIGEYFHLAREATCTFEVFPRHIYDPQNTMGSYNIGTLNDSEELSKIMQQDSSLSSFAKVFNSPDFTQKTISGCGPYKLKAWEIDQYIALEKKVDYWGTNYPERNLLANNPKNITFRMITDESAAITLLKDESIDLLNVMNATAFENLKGSANFDSLFTLHTPPLSRFYYIGLNSRKPELNDKDVRRALAHLLDVDGIIETLESGYGNRQVGTIMPNSPFFNNALKPILYDLEKANAILDEEGWIDSNGDGTRDKTFNGRVVELDIDFLASQSPLGQKVALILQDNAKKAGVKVNLVIKEGRQINEALYSHQFEASASATGLSLAPYDPYQRWHSDNSQQGKGNIFGYLNERNDELIETIRTTQDIEERQKAYDEFQQLMYDEQPVIYLYSPVQKFVLNKKFKGLFSAKRPGYFVGSFELID